MCVVCVRACVHKGAAKPTPLQQSIEQHRQQQSKAAADRLSSKRLAHLCGAVRHVDPLHAAVDTVRQGLAVREVCEGCVCVKANSH